MDTLSLAQQLLRAAKRLTHAQRVTTGRVGEELHIHVLADDGQLYEIVVRKAKG